MNFEIFNAGGEVNNFTKKMIVDTIASYISDPKIKFSDNGSDPRNYKVSFNKVKKCLGFEPKHTVKDGIEELLNAFSLGLYSDSLTSPEIYGNYDIKYK